MKVFDIFLMFAQNIDYGYMLEPPHNLCFRAKIRKKCIPLYYMSRVERKPAFCICENKDADQLRGYGEADQRLCFRYIDSTIPLLSKSEISSL